MTHPAHQDTAPRASSSLWKRRWMEQRKQRKATHGSVPSERGHQVFQLGRTSSFPVVLHLFTKARDRLWDDGLLLLHRIVPQKAEWVVGTEALKPHRCACLRAPAHRPGQVRRAQNAVDLLPHCRETVRRAVSLLLRAKRESHTQRNTPMHPVNNLP